MLSFAYFLYHIMYVGLMVCDQGDVFKESKGRGTHQGESGTRGLRGAANWAKNGTPYILVFTAISSLMEHVNTFNGRYLPKEAFFQTIEMNNVYFKGENEA